MKPKMTFEEQIENYFPAIAIKMSDEPARHLYHLYADYVELVSLFSNKNYVSSSDILDRLKDEGIIKTNNRDEERAGANDANEKWVDDIFRTISQRKFLFADEYPFELCDGDKIRLKGTISDINKVYLYVLISSSLNLFHKFQSVLTTEFEQLSYEVLKQFLPPRSVVKSFGKNSEYTGTATEKIRKLAHDLSIEIDENSLNKISKTGNQERGLDVIGWIDFQDGVANLLAVLGQCACGKEWYKKLNETLRYEQYCRFRSKKPIHAMFIPYSLINPQDSDFYQADEIHDTLVFERKRILKFVSDFSFFEDVESSKLVEKCISFEEDIV